MPDWLKNLWQRWQNWRFIQRSWDEPVDQDIAEDFVQGLDEDALAIQAAREAFGEDNGVYRHEPYTGCSIKRSQRAEGRNWID